MITNLSEGWSMSYFKRNTFLLLKYLNSLIHNGLSFFSEFVWEFLMESLSHYFPVVKMRSVNEWNYFEIYTPFIVKLAKMYFIFTHFIVVIRIKRIRLHCIFTESFTIKPLVSKAALPSIWGNMWIMLNERLFYY